MQSVRQSLVDCGISTEVADVILSSWRKSTFKQYNVYNEKWSTFCLSRQSHFIRGPVQLILDFLHDLYTKGYGYSSLNTARSAISALYTIDKTDVGQNIGKHQLIRRFMKGVFNEIPPTPKFQEVWRVEQVLAYLEQLTPLHALKLKELTLKLVMLIALVTGERCQTLSFFGYFRRTHKKNIPSFLYRDTLNKTNQVTCLAMCACFSTQIKLCVFTLHLNIILKLRSHYGSLLSCLYRILSLIMKFLVLR